MSVDMRMVVTGAANGIGRALVHEGVRRGMLVAAIDIDSDSLQELKRIYDDRVVAIGADVSSEENLQSAYQEIESTIGRPDIWINNAGIASLGGFENSTSDDFERVIRTNFFGVVYGTRIALKNMKKPERGTIVNVTSLNGSIPAPFMSSYVASKHAVVGFTRSLQEELKQTHSPIQAILVSPGFVETKIMEARSGFEFPKKLSFLIEKPAEVAKEILKGIDERRPEIIPTLHGKLLLKMNRIAPDWMTRSSRLLTAKNWKELLGLQPIE